VNNSNLLPIAHHFQDIVDYGSNFRCRQEKYPSLTNFIPGEPLSSGWRNLVPRNKIVLLCDAKHISLP